MSEKKNRKSKNDPPTAASQAQDVTDWERGIWHGVSVPESVTKMVREIVAVAHDARALPDNRDRGAAVRHLQCAVESLVLAAAPDFEERVEAHLGRPIRQRVHR